MEISKKVSRNSAWRRRRKSFQNLPKTVIIDAAFDIIMLLPEANIDMSLLWTN